jgi:hypothetical protein
MIQTINKAVQQATGVTFEQYTAPGKKRERYFARLIFSHNCFTIEKMNYREVAIIVNRNPSTVFKYPEFFRNEVNVNSDFRKLVRLTEKNLNQNVSQ